MFNKNFSKEPTDKQKIGKKGEDLATEYLSGIGYTILERNYLKKWGELDIVAKKGKIIHFIEVKSVTRCLGSVTHVTTVAEHSSLRGRQNDSYQPEDNMHPRKLQRLARAVQSYLLDRNVSDETEWQFDLVTVRIDTDKGLHKIEVLEDIVL